MYTNVFDSPGDSSWKKTVRENPLPTSQEQQRSHSCLQWKDGDGVNLITLLTCTVLPQKTLAPTKITDIAKQVMAHFKIWAATQLIVV